jgi:hypothetical protein
MAASVNSNWAPLGPRRRSRSSRRMRLRWANNISMRFLSRRDCSNASVLASARATFTRGLVDAARDSAHRRPGNDLVGSSVMGRREAIAEGGEVCPSSGKASMRARRTQRRVALDWPAWTSTLSIAIQRMVRASRFRSTCKRCPRSRHSTAFLRPAILWLSGQKSRRSPASLWRPGLWASAAAET